MTIADRAVTIANGAAAIADRAEVTGAPSDRGQPADRAAPAVVLVIGLFAARTHDSEGSRTAGGGTRSTD
ncbi:hypothetical protein ACGFWI_36860 [Streptomyces sp. NPDC048434]|uniref:hypothetical protein n=1 Tax=Streptomyces sp. NPDC048434 TaxID=3365549 RepID=UPI00371A0544